MKILLVNPPFNIAKENYDSSISVGLLSIATYLDSKGVNVKLIDGARQKNYLDLLNANIADADFIGLSVMTTQIPSALAISQKVRELNPRCKIIWGGAHPTFFIEQTAEHELVDIVIYGEGEETMLEIASNKDLAEINGIAYKYNNEGEKSAAEGERSASRLQLPIFHLQENGKVKINPARALHDPATMPLFNWDLVDREVLEHLFLIPSLTSRGCPHLCTFCINAILKYQWRPRTAEQVLKDLEIIVSKDYFKDKRLRFWDENFFVDINRARKIIDGMIAGNLNIAWETTVRANYIKPGMIADELMTKLKQSGCYLLSFGAESGSQRILDKIKKGITPDEIVNSARACLRHGIIPQYSFMIGLPGEEKSDMMQTLKLIDRLVKLSDQVQILGPQAFRPYPGSQLFAECIQSGWHSPNSLAEWNSYVQNELNYLNIQNFPWVKDKNLVESMEAYVRFGAHSFSSAMGSSVKAQKIIKFGFVLLCQLRWRLKFFALPFDFKLAKKYVTK